MTTVKTEPMKRWPKSATPKPDELAAGRYGTLEMAGIWGPEKTFSYSLKAQAQAVRTLSDL